MRLELFIIFKNNYITIVEVYIRYENNLYEYNSI